MAKIKVSEKVEEVKNEVSAVAIVGTDGKRSITSVAKTFATAMPIEKLSNLTEAQIAIANGNFVDEVRRLRTAKICESVYKKRWYQPEFKTYEEWAQKFPPLKATNKQSAYDYLNVAKMLTVGENDEILSGFVNRKGETLIFSFSQLLEIYKAYKRKDEESGIFVFEVTEFALVNELIQNGIERKAIPAKSAKKIGKEILDACTMSVETAEKGVFSDYVFLSPKMVVRAMREFLKVAKGDAEDDTKEVSDGESESESKDDTTQKEVEQKEVAKLNVDEYIMTIYALRKVAENDEDEHKRKFCKELADKLATIAYAEKVDLKGKGENHAFSLTR